MMFRFVRQAPIEIDAHNPNIVYHGSQYVHRTIGEIMATVPGMLDRLGKFTIAAFNASSKPEQSIAPDLGEAEPTP